MQFNRSFCFIVIVSALGLLLLNNALPSSIDTGPIWTSNGATHDIYTPETEGNYTLRARQAAFGGAVDTNIRIKLDLSTKDNFGCAQDDFASLSNVTASDWILLMRGDCSFVEKVKQAQDAGLEGVIVGDDGSSYDSLVTMFARYAPEVVIPSLFITHHSYTLLRSATDDRFISLTIQQSQMRTDWPLLDTLVFICFSPLCTLLIVYVVLYFRRRKLHLANILPPAYLDKLHTLLYLPKDGVNADCVICLEQFDEGEEVLELPCHHIYHDACIKKWLIERKKVCPICVRDVRLGIDIREGRIEEAAVVSEQTPLLPATASIPADFQREVIAERQSLRSSQSRQSLQGSQGLSRSV